MKNESEDQRDHSGNRQGYGIGSRGTAAPAANAESLSRNGAPASELPAAQEAGGEQLDIGFIFIHGQDHLMTTLLLRELVQDFVELYKKNK